MTRSRAKPPALDRLVDHWMLKAGVWTLKGLLGILLALGLYAYRGDQEKDRAVDAKIIEKIDRVEAKVDASAIQSKSLEDNLRAIVDEFRAYKAEKNVQDAAIHEKVSGHEERLSTLERREALQRREEWEASFKLYMDERATAARKKK